jgi:tRNA pseudouridine55 synthase
MSRAPQTEELQAGVLLVDKPDGPTSHDVVVRARRVLEERRIGHTGTLDPFASGLLILCLGAGTRLASFFHLLPKRYSARIVFGSETETDDRTGTELRRSEAWRGLSRTDVEATLVGMEGERDQVPPAFSAKRIAGRRAYEAARAGERLVLPTSSVRVFSARLHEFHPPEATVDFVVSTGTYIRALARDAGRALGCLAHLGALRRSEIGPFTLNEAVPADRLAESAGSLRRAWRSPAEAVGWMDARKLGEAEAERVAHGGTIPASAIEPSTLPAGYPPAADGPIALLFKGTLVAVARREGTHLQPVKVFRVG